MLFIEYIIHNPSDDTGFPNLAVPKNYNTSNLFNIRRCSVGLPIDSLNGFISVVVCSTIVGNQVILDYEIHAKRYLLAQEQTLIVGAGAC